MGLSIGVAAVRGAPHRGAAPDAAAEAAVQGTRPRLAVAASSQALGIALARGCSP